MSYKFPTESILELETRVSKIKSAISSMTKDQSELMPQLYNELTKLMEVIEVKKEQQQWIKDSSKHATESDLCFIYRQ